MAAKREPQAKRKGRGAQPKWSREQRASIEALLVEWVSNGKTLREFCRQDGMPKWRTVYDWLAEDTDFAARVARARDLGFEALAQETLAIADETCEGVRTEEGENDKGSFSKTVREDMLGHRKLRIETRLKLLACWDPKRYGNHPKASGEPFRIALPEIKSAADIPAAFDAAVVALREGRIDFDDLAKIERLLAGYRAAFGEAEFAREMAELRAQVEALRG